MNTLIPLESYSNVYYIVLLLFIISFYFQSLKTDFEDKKVIGIIFLLFVLLYIGLRPISFVFVDMGTYNLAFERYQQGEAFESNKDVFFDYFLFLSTKIMNAEMFFFVCASLYIMPLYFASKKIFENYWFYSFLILVASLSFWAYGVNGIRNGIATSIFILGMSKNNKIAAFSIVLLSTFIHTSMLLPFIAFLAANYYTNSKTYLKIWFVMIPLSLFLGNFFASFFTTLGLVEESRISGYLTESEIDLGDVVEKAGFRWDFLLYSATGVFAGWYFIVKKNFEDQFYTKLYNTYLFSNAIWILVIKANFSNRFAYLSWFMLGLVIIYPFLKMRFYNHQHELALRIILLYFLFTFLLGYIW